VDRQMIGKTIKSTAWIKGLDGSEAIDGYGQLVITFTDGTRYEISYSCMGGVCVDELEGVLCEQRHTVKTK